MKIADLIQLAENRLAAIQTTRASLWQIGDAIGVANADKELAEVQQTLNQLRSLNG